MQPWHAVLKDVSILTMDNYGERVDPLMLQSCLLLIVMNVCVQNKKCGSDFFTPHMGRQWHSMCRF